MKIEWIKRLQLSLYFIFGGQHIELKEESSPFANCLKHLKSSVELGQINNSRGEDESSHLKVGLEL